MKETIKAARVEGEKRAKNGPTASVMREPMLGPGWEEVAEQVRYVDMRL